VSLESGRAAYVNSCVFCHGADGTGGHGGPAFTLALSADAIQRTVSGGRNQMPAFGSFLDETAVANVSAWVLELARRAGCRVAEARLEKVDGQIILLSRRFDRSGKHRIHFSSAMNLLGLTDGDRSSYAEIADLMQRTGGDPVELFRRMVVNISINNVDDHLRNHGFLRSGGSWELSPAYDVNPISKFEKAPQLCTAVVPDAFEASTELAIENAELFNLDKPGAKAICEEVAAAVGMWRSVAQSVGAPRREVEAIESAFGP